MTPRTLTRTPVRYPRRITAVRGGCAHPAPRRGAWADINHDNTSRVLTAVLTAATVVSVGIAYLMLRWVLMFALWALGVI